MWMLVLAAALVVGMLPAVAAIRPAAGPLPLTGPACDRTTITPAVIVDGRGHLWVSVWTDDLCVTWRRWSPGDPTGRAGP